MQRGLDIALRSYERLGEVERLVTVLSPPGYNMLKRKIRCISRICIEKRIGSLTGSPIMVCKVGTNCVSCRMLLMGYLTCCLVP
ncbi:hypothetical protein K1719_040104 [Acacia pycnantha]|nr:hypothetical protein K1719_040104 [Acacia pycnantha]